MIPKYSENEDMKIIHVQPEPKQDNFTRLNSNKKVCVKTME